MTQRLITEEQERAIRSDVDAGIRLSGNEALRLLAEIDALRAGLDKAGRIVHAMCTGGECDPNKLAADLATERAETARLNASLLAYWGQFGCVSEDTSAWQAKLDEAEQRGREAERTGIARRIDDWADQLPRPMGHLAAEIRELAKEVRSGPTIPSDPPHSNG